jgi:phage shock protein PspC (stress-responsive transcriptional regulator)
MPEQLCDRMTSILATHLALDVPLDDDWRDHVRVCATCAEVCRRAEILVASFDKPMTDKETNSMNELTSLAEETTRTTHRRRLIWRTFAAILVAGAAVGSWIEAAPLHHPYLVMTVMILLLLAPIFLIWRNARAATQPPRRLYKRMTGRSLSGVCSGIAYSLHVPAWTIQLAFLMFACLLSARLTIGLYLVFDLALQIDPEDREKLLRFRIARWWRRRFAAA